MDHDVALVLAGGVIGIVSSFGLAWLQHGWEVRHRRNEAERHALDLTVQSFLAWKEFAMALAAGSDPHPARERLRKLDLQWQVDPRLVPDHKAAGELIGLCKQVWMIPPDTGGPALEVIDRILELTDQVLDSARERYRELA